MCLESDPLRLVEEFDDALRLFYGGTPPPNEESPQGAAAPQSQPDAAAAEPVA